MKSMTPSSKAQTGNIQPSSSGENTEALVQPSKQSASSDNTQTYTLTTKPPSKSTKIAKISERSRDHALIMKASLYQLRKAGLVKLYAVLSEDKTQIEEIQVVFDPAIWTTKLELKDEA